MRYYVLGLSIFLFAGAFFLSKKMKKVKIEEYRFVIGDYPIYFKGDISVEKNVANGSFDLNIIDIFSGFKGDKSIYLDIKEKIEAAPKAKILFQSLQLPKSGYFNLRGVLMIGESKHIIHGVGFRNDDDLEIKFPVTLDEIGLELSEENKDKFPRRVNILGYINVP